MVLTSTLFTYKPHRIAFPSPFMSFQNVCSLTHIDKVILSLKHFHHFEYSFYILLSDHVHFIPLCRTAEFVCLYKGFHSVSLIQIAQDFTNVLPSTHWGRFGLGSPVWRPASAGRNHQRAIVHVTDNHIYNS